MEHRWRDLKTRTISASILSAFVLFALFYHPDSFAMLMLIAFFIGFKEWNKLCPSPKQRFAYTLSGFVLLAACSISLSFLRYTPIDSYHIASPSLPVLGLFTIVASIDISGYFFGRLIGGALCWPSISPGKTWSGTIASFLTGTLTSLFFFSYFYGYPLQGSLLLFSFLLSATAIFGDAMESWLKRRAGVKDSGNLLPGHGGLLDRIDGLILSAPLFTLFLHIA